MIAAQADRIAGDHLYARLQQNNHAISEGVGLWTVGVLFPWLRKAKKWQEQGKNILESEAGFQIYPDGAYIQKSTNYHRLMLQDYLFAVRIGQVNGFHFSEELMTRLKKAADFLEQMVDQICGHVPNTGANDGALILPLNVCDYRDFRPVCESLHYLFNENRLYERGPWHEDLLWCFGTKALDAPVSNQGIADLDAPTGGYYTLCGGPSWGMVRCGPFFDRPGDADLLHLDLWLNGVNIAPDAGTYMYYGKIPWNNPLRSTEHHNTVTVDNLDQMTRGPRFMWFDWPKAKVRYRLVSEGGQLKYFEGEHTGYERLPEPILHRRAVVKAGHEIWVVFDDLLGRGNHHFRIHWLLADLPHEVREDQRTVTLKTPTGLFMQVMGIAFPKATYGKWDLVRGDETTAPRGWISRYYGSREPTLSSSLETAGEAPLRFITVFCPESGNSDIQFSDREVRVSSDGNQLDLSCRAPGEGSVVKSMNWQNLDKKDHLY